ncbi:MAG TPA: ABC transporter substrate-binding protein [Myxococcaceae bacterium]|nr:ABC transporter substrate-binding protein [Myxococcaceae bacterium]
MKPIASTGDLSETAFADVLDHFCKSGQTAAVAVAVPRASGGDATGLFFIDAGALVDARFDGREGSEAVRHALKIHRGRFQVELGARTPRRTVHESWSALSPSPGASSSPPSPPQLFPVGAPPTAPAAAAPAPSGPAPSEGSSPPGSPGGAGPRRTTGSVSVTAAPATPPAAPRRATSDVVPATPAAPGHRPAHPEGSGAHAGPPALSPHTSGARRVTGEAPHPVQSGPHTPFPGAPAHRPPHSSGPSTSPFSGPHTPPAHHHPPHHGTAPFSSVRKEHHRARFLRVAVLIALAVTAGGGLAAAVALLLNRSHVEPAAQPAVAAAPPAPAAPTVRGVTDTEISLGMSSALTGPAKELGRQMRIGLDVAFARANAEGGVHGRKVKLVAADDGYEPARTKETMRELAEQRGVFGFIGNVGTPTAVVAVPYALERKMLFFGPFTGASLLRKEPPDRYVFNYRASYLEETAAVVRYLVEIRHIKPDQIAVFAQDDAFGDAGFQGVAKALRNLRKSSSPILKVTYKRNTADVADAVSRILDRKSNVAAVVMVAAYRPAAHFIEKVKDQRPGMVFTNVSFVGSQALAEELTQLGQSYAQGVIVTQVVPLPTGQSTVGIRYREALAAYAPGEKPDFVSLEGYVDGLLMVEALKRAGRDVTTESLVDTLESIHGLDLGLGVQLNFGPSEHQASHKVWGTVIDQAGNFLPLELE